LLAVLLASVVSIGAAGLGHSGWDDAACDPIPVHHDHNAHRFVSGRLPGGDPDHCLFCHSLRSLGNGLITTHALVVDVADAATIRTSASTATGRPLDSNAPSRAPPSSRA
jgi:hypothetical protein